MILGWPKIANVMTDGRTEFLSFILFSYHVLTNRQVVQAKCAIVVKPSVLNLFYLI